MKWAFQLKKSLTTVTTTEHYFTFSMVCLIVEYATKEADLFTKKSRTIIIFIGGTAMKDSDDLGILGVTHDSKMTFEKHLWSVSRAASQRLGILRKSWLVFHDRLLLGRCFQGFVLPVLQYCSAVW